MTGREERFVASHPTALPGQQHKRPIHLLRVETGLAGLLAIPRAPLRLLDLTAGLSEYADTIPPLTQRRLSGLRAEGELSRLGAPLGSSRT